MNRTSLVRRADSLITSEQGERTNVRKLVAFLVHARAPLERSFRPSAALRRRHDGELRWLRRSALRRGGGRRVLGSTEMIDDMEDGNDSICESGGRRGRCRWYTVADGTEGTLSPAQGAAFTMSSIPGGRGDSRMAAHMTASGFTEWAEMGLSLNYTGGVGMPY